MSSFEDSLLKDTGPSIRIYQLAKGLASVGNEVHIIIPGNQTKREYVDGLVVHKIRGFLPKKTLDIFSKFLGVSRSTSLLFYDYLFIYRAMRIIRKSHLVQIEQQSASGLMLPVAVGIFKKPVSIDCHDIFQSLRVKHTSVIRRILETFLEKIAYKYSDLMLAVSEQEKKVLVSYGIEKENVEVIPNGVDTEAFDPLKNVTEIRDRHVTANLHTVIFVGNMEYLPNQEAVEVIASEIAPKVQKEVSNIRFLIVGRMNTRMELSNLTYTGVVDNVARFLKASDVAIAPLFHGTGTRLKILEYLSCGLPVVSTSVGIEGLDVTNEVNALIEDNMDEFAKKVIMLLKDVELSKKLGKAARELAVNKYDWRMITRRLDAVYRTLLIKKRLSG